MDNDQFLKWVNGRSPLPAGAGFRVHKLTEVAMEKPKGRRTDEPDNFEWIEGMTKDFPGPADADFTNDGAYRHWHLRLLLAIAQQLSVISHELKKN
jgi:hypothetical protein